MFLSYEGGSYEEAPMRRVIVSEFVSLDGVLILTYRPAGEGAEGQTE